MSEAGPPSGDAPGSAGIGRNIIMFKLVTRVDDQFLNNTWNIYSDAFQRLDLFRK